MYSRRPTEQLTEPNRDASRDENDAALHTISISHHLDLTYVPATGSPPPSRDRVAPSPPTALYCRQPECCCCRGMYTAAGEMLAAHTAVPRGLHTHVAPRWRRRVGMHMVPRRIVESVAAWPH